MPLNITSTETPPIVAATVTTISAAGDPGIKETLAQSPLDKPIPLQGISASKMEPKAQAGYNLAKFVLWIATGTIVAFILYLFWIDYSVSKDVLAEYSVVSYPAVPNADSVDLKMLQRYADTLTLAQRNPTYVFNTADAKNAAELLKSINQMTTLSDTQRAESTACTALPTDASRDEKLSECLSRILEVRQIVMEARAARSAKFANDALDRLSTQRKVIHDFWLQAAQLVLLNLLLPLLTALFGYIFGTQSQQKDAG